MSFEIPEKTVKTIAFVRTMLAPAGRLNATDIISPTAKQVTDITDETIVTVLKVLQTLIAVRGGKIISADISIAPIIFIPVTIVSADKKAIIALYISVFIQSLI